MWEYEKQKTIDEVHVDLEERICVHFHDRDKDLKDLKYVKITLEISMLSRFQIICINTEMVVNGFIKPLSHM